MFVENKFHHHQQLFSESHVPSTVCQRSASIGTVAFTAGVGDVVDHFGQRRGVHDARHS